MRVATVSPCRFSQVRLNVPLAGKVTNLSYFKKPRETEPPLPPPEFKHKIAEATFPMEELRGALLGCPVLLQLYVYE